MRPEDWSDVNEGRPSSSKMCFLASLTSPPPNLTVCLLQVGHIKMRLYDNTCHSMRAPKRVAISGKETGPALTCQPASKKTVWASRKPPRLMENYWLCVQISWGAAV